LAKNNCKAPVNDENSMLTIIPVNATRTGSSPLPTSPQTSDAAASPPPKAISKGNSPLIFGKNIAQATTKK